MDWQMLLMIVLSVTVMSCSGQFDRAQAIAGTEKLRKLPQVDTCGKSVLPMGVKIIDGKPAKLGAYPWMAAIGYRSRGSTVTQWLCGGSLITDQHIITAAHCVIPELTEGYSVYEVRLGELDLNETVADGASPVDIRAGQIISHQQYNNNEKRNDIAIIKLQRKVQFTDLIKPICLPPPEFSTNMFVGYSPIIAGWGRSTLDPTVKPPTRLLEAEIKIHDTEQCRKNVTTKLRKVIIDNTVICAASEENDSCQGDSGGPLMFYRKTKNLPPESTGNMFLMGITSYGYSCAEPGYPGLYTRVSQQMNWIIDHLDI